jgi:hypothetical protein
VGRTIASRRWLRPRARRRALAKGVAVLLALIGVAFGLVSPSDATHD